MKNVHIISLGCARNLVDSEVMAGLLNREGYHLTGQAQDAELIIVNTCGFINEAKQESVDTILEAAQFKDPQRGRCQQLVVAGCLSERYPGEIKESLPEVDLVLGTSAFSKIIGEVEKINKEAASDADIRETSRFERAKDYDLPRINSQPFYTAYLKLAEGCAKRCSFCVIPDLRGPLRSRSVPMLIKEAMSLVQGGARELNLIAQDLTDFGRDRKDSTSLPTLLKQLSKIEKLKWLRLFYAYPDQLSDDVLELIATEDKICKYLDVPVQHISDRVLRDMNRKTNGKQIRDMLVRLKKDIPGVVLRTSLMVGFPNESESEFNELRDFVAEGLLDQVGVFTYSHEEGTASAKKFKDSVSEEEKQYRQAAIYETQQAVQDKKLQTWIGQKLEVLVEGVHDETELLLKARHYGQGPGVDNLTLINEGQASAGDFVTVEITDLAGPDLVARILEE